MFPGEVTCLHAERFGVTVKLWTTHLRGINWPALHSNLRWGNWQNIEHEVKGTHESSSTT